MSDIVRRLREPKVIDPARGMVRQASALECDAADEIERLRSALDRGLTAFRAYGKRPVACFDEAIAEMEHALKLSPSTGDSEDGR